MKLKIDLKKAKECGLSDSVITDLMFSDEEEMIDILIRNSQAYEFIKKTWIENEREFDLEEICNKLYEDWGEYLNLFEKDVYLNYGYPFAIRKFLKQVNYDPKKIEYLDRKIEEKIDTEITDQDLKWYANIKKLKLQGKSIDEISENERVLYKEERIDSSLYELNYNWKEIYNMKNLPKGMKEIFLKDEKGDAIGADFIDWEYVQKIQEKRDLIDELPTFIGLTLEAIENLDYAELAEIMPRRRIFR